MGHCLAIDVKYQAEAYRLVIQFQMENDPIVKRVNKVPPGTDDEFDFSKIKLDDIIEQLYERLEDTSSINQGGANLCGPAAVMFCWLCKRPDLYVQYVLNMYKRGNARMGSLFVQPGKDCRNHKPENIRDVDWVALAALRDSYNSGFDFDSEPNYLGAITMPDEIEKWFENIGFNVLESRTAAVCSEGYESLRKAVLHVMEGCCVCLLVNATKIFGGPWWDMNLTANHWIVMTSEPKINGVSILSIPSENGLLDKLIDFEVYTWGERKYLQKWRKVVLGDFLDGFYGFIAAKHDENSAFARKLSLLSEFGKKLPY